MQTPGDVALERSLLGALLQDTQAAADVYGKISPADFYQPRHRDIFAAIINLYARGWATDLATVMAELERMGEAGKVGRAAGLAYLSELRLEAFGASATVYADQVADIATHRRVFDKAEKIAQLAKSRDTTGAEIISLVQAEIMSLTAHTDAEHLKPLATVAKNSLLPPPPGMIVPTGFTDLDHRLGGGFRREQLVLVAARPSQGKSALALDFARHASVNQGATTLFFSLEMSEDELGHRALAAEANLGLDVVQAAQRTGTTSDFHRQKLDKVLEKLEPAPCFIDSTPHLTTALLASKVRQFRQRHDLSLLVIDYLQLMTPDISRKNDSRQAEVARIGRELKLLAQEQHIVVLAVAQLNRDSENRADSTPRLSDLRDSGTLEQDANVALLLSPEDRDDKTAKTRPFLCDVAKQRNGPTGPVHLNFEQTRTRFTSATPPSQTEPPQGLL